MKKRIDELTELLNKACKAYYKDSNPIMSDYDFDKLYVELLKLEKEHPEYERDDSPTKNVGWHEVVDEIKTVELNHPMLSLDKCHSVEELFKFAGNNKCFLSVKCDGLSTTLEYLDGKLVSACTRGNGIQGSDVLTNVITIRNIPKTIDYKEHLIIDGETIIDYETFNKINDSLPKGVEKYKHPRNLASASLNLLDNSIARERGMSFIAWKVIEGFNEINSNYGKLKAAEKNGFTVVPMMMYCKEEGDNLSGMVEMIKDIAKENNIPCDGAVLAVDDVEKASKMGRTEKFFLNAIAYKYEDELYETVLRDIIWQTSKTGQMTPVAVFNEIDLDGAITSRATLHNPDYIENLQLGIGDRILVRRANAVIPRVEDNIDRSGTYEFPTTCSCCGGRAEMKKEGKSKILYCMNPNCSSKLLGNLTHAVSRDAIDVDGLSEATLEFLINKGWVSSLKDIYHLEKYKLSWSNCSGFGETSVKKILKAIESSRNTNLQRFLYSLSIPQVGKTASKQIAKICNGDFEYFINHVGEVRNKLTNTPGYGSAISYAISNYFKENLDMAKDLAKEFNFDSEEFMNKPICGDFKLAGMTFVVTGSVHIYKNRKELQKVIEDNGGKVTSSVTKNVTYLINNDVNSSSSKNVAAKKLGISILSEEDFQELLK